MASKQAKLGVDRWQQGRPHWNYDPALQFWFRFVMCALHDALQVEGGAPTDEALLARDWFATSQPGFVVNGRREFVSFYEACHWLGLNVDVERVGILAAIDAHADFDTDELFARLDELSAMNPDDTAPLFETPELYRVVPVRDQLSLLPQSELVDAIRPARCKNPPAISVIVEMFKEAHAEQGSLFGLVN